MSNFIPFETPGGVIWIQVEDSVNGSSIISVSQSKAFSSFADVTQALIANAQYVRELLEELAPSSIDISFGIKAGINPGPTATTGTPIFSLSKSMDEANYNVIVKWRAQNNES